MKDEKVTQIVEQINRYNPEFLDSQQQDRIKACDDSSAKSLLEAIHILGNTLDHPNFNFILRCIETELGSIAHMLGLEPSENDIINDVLSLSDIVTTLKSSTIAYPRQFICRVIDVRHKLFPQQLQSNLANAQQLNLTTFSTQNRIYLNSQNEFNNALKKLL